MVESYHPRFLTQNNWIENANLGKFKWLIIYKFFKIIEPRQLIFLFHLLVPFYLLYSNHKLD